MGNSIEDKLKQIPNKKFILLSKLSKFKLKRDSFTLKNLQSKPKRRKLKTKRKSEKKKCNSSSRKREWSSRGKMKSTTLNSRSKSNWRQTNLMKLNSKPNKLILTTN